MKLKGRSRIEEMMYANIYVAFDLPIIIIRLLRLRLALMSISCVIILLL